jgi:hypothetical protein
MGVRARAADAAADHDDRLALTIRRLIDPKAWPVALIVLMGCTSTMLMYAPERIDHHGWQLACLALTVAGLADPRRARGGATVGLSSALSLTIGLEMLPYCAMAGAILTLRWVWGAAEAKQQAALEAGAMFGEDVIVPRRPRDVGLMVYGLTLSGGSCLGFAIFGSYANMAMRCDALTPVWLTVMIAGACCCSGSPCSTRPTAGCGWRWRGSGGSDRGRLCLAVPAMPGAAGTGFARAGEYLAGERPRGAADLQASAGDCLPDRGAAGDRRDRRLLRHLAGWRNSPSVIGWAAVALFTTFAGLMLLWQVRAGPAAQMLSGAGLIGAGLDPDPLVHEPALAAGAGAGIDCGVPARLGPVRGLCRAIPPCRAEGPQPGADKTGAANAACARVSTLIRLNAIPTATMFTHVDLGPRLITITHHNGIAGPYHRNERQILDVHHAFTGAPEAFRPIAAAHKAKYLLICPNMAETTVYRARNQYGFYGQLHRGRVPHWLEPVELPKNSPFRLWTIRYDLPDEPAGFWIKPPVRKAPPPAVEAPKLPVKK